MKRLAPFFFILFLISILFIPYFFPREGQMLFGGDIYDAYFFWKGYLRDSILSGFIPFWNPYNFSGTPFLAHPNINIFYPLNWVFILFPLQQSFTIYMFLHMVIAGISMYWLGRQYTDKYGALFCAVCYSLGSYFSARMYAGHPEYIDTAAWMPLVFGLTRRALLEHSKKTFVVAVLGMGILFLSGNELFILYTLEILGLYTFYLFFTFQKRNFLNLIKNLGLLFSISLLSFGITAYEVLPRLQFLSLSLRSEGVPYGVAGSGSLPVSGLHLFLQPFFFGLPENFVGPWPNLTEYLYYVGVLPIVLIAGFIASLLLKKWIKRFRFSDISSDVWFFLLIVIPFFLLISFGSYSIVNFHELLWKYVPFYHSYRFPVRHLFVVFFSLSLVSGILVGKIKNRYTQVFCIAILAFNLLWVNSHFFRMTDTPVATFDQNLIERLTENEDVYRVLPDFAVVSGVRRDVDFGAAALSKFYSTSDYNSMILSRYYRFVDLANQSAVPSTSNYNVEIPPLQPGSPYVDFLNVKYVLSDKSADAALSLPDQYTLVFEGTRYRLYKNASYLPRFFLVNQVRVFPTELSIEQVILNRRVDFSSTVLFLSQDVGDSSKFDLRCDVLAKQTVSILTYTANKIRLSTTSACGAFLSSSEVYYPGWKATIDGKNVPIYRSNYAFRSAYIPPGEHIVEFYYFPDIFLFGAVISLIVVLGLFLFSRNVFLKRKK